MPAADVNGVNLYYELHGRGEPLALVHGLAALGRLRLAAAQARSGRGCPRSHLSPHRRVLKTVNL